MVEGATDMILLLFWVQGTINKSEEWGISNRESVNGRINYD